jgi:putative CocE/NonD family hydrolase
MMDARPGRYDVDFHGDVRVPSSVAGLTLGADLYLPKGTGPVPALVTLHTGRKDGLGGQAARRYLRYFAERGYAVLYVDCFGIGTSQGLPRPILSPAEVDDGVGVVEWAAAQPWCTGSVGMWGLSHGGMTTLAVASRRPPHLRAIFPAMGWTNAERDLVHPGGQRGGIAMFGHLSLYHLFCALLPPLRRHDQDTYRQLWLDRLERFEPWFVDSWRHGPGDEAWVQRGIDPGRITVPALCVAGWRDLFCDVMIDAYLRIDAPKQLLVGPWLHSFPDASVRAPVSSVALACAWWDRWLHGEPEPAADTRESSAIVHVQGGEGRWARSAQWPPAGVRPLMFTVTRGGELRPIIDGGAAGTIARQSSVTVGVLSGLTKHPIDRFGYPLDQHEDDSRSLAFTTQPLTDSLLVAGTPAVTLVLAEDTTAARCVLKLTDVDEQGRSMLISAGLVSLDGVRVVSVRLDPTCYQVRAGHRLRLVLAESDLPRLWPVESPGLLSVRTTTGLSLPVVDADQLPDADVPVPDRRSDGARTGDPAGCWEISRDHLGGSIRLSLAKTDRIGRLNNSASALAMTTEIQLDADEGAPLATRMVAAGEKTADIENGDRAVVRGSIDMGTFDATVHAEVLVNDTVLFTKEWKLSAR